MLRTFFLLCLSYLGGLSCSGFWVLEALSLPPKSGSKWVIRALRPNLLAPKKKRMKMVELGHYIAFFLLLYGKIPYMLAFVMVF